MGRKVKNHWPKRTSAMVAAACVLIVVCSFDGTITPPANLFVSSESCCWVSWSVFTALGCDAKPFAHSPGTGMPLDATTKQLAMEALNGQNWCMQDLFGKTMVKPVTRKGYLQANVFEYQRKVTSSSQRYRHLGKDCTKIKILYRWDGIKAEKVIYVKIWEIKTWKPQAWPKTVVLGESDAARSAKQPQSCS